jgi:hypothetical protein
VWVWVWVRVWRDTWYMAGRMVVDCIENITRMLATKLHLQHVGVELAEWDGFNIYDKTKEIVMCPDSGSRLCAVCAWALPLLGVRILLFPCRSSTNIATVRAFWESTVCYRFLFWFHSIGLAQPGTCRL